MAQTFFLEMTGLSGGSQAAHYEGAFEVTSYGFEGENSGALTGGGAGGGKADLSPLQVTLADETGLTDFLTLLASGQHVTGASLIGTKSDGGGLSETYRINLSHVIVTGVQETAGHGFVVTLDYLDIGVIAQTQTAAGGVGTPQTFGFDQVASALQTPPPNAVPGPAGVPTTANQYFLLVDGVDGGSAAERHAHWFDVSSFDFDVEALVSIDAGGIAVGKSDFDPFTVELPNLGGLTQLLTRLADGGALAGLRLEGVTSDGVTYRLNLADVHVRDIQETETEGYRVSFDFGRIQLTTRSQQTSGGLGPEHTFSWNLVDNSTNIGTLPTLRPGGPQNQVPVGVAASVTTPEDLSLHGSVSADRRRRRPADVLESGRSIPRIADFGFGRELHLHPGD